MAQSPILTPDQQASITRFNQKHPGFNVNSVSDLGQNNQQFSKESLFDYFNLMKDLGTLDSGPNKNFFFNPATGQFRQEQSGLKAALTGVLGAAGLITGGLALAPLLGGGAAGAGAAAAGAGTGAGLGAGAGVGAAVSGSLGSQLLKYGIPAAVSAGTGLYANHQQNKANEKTLNAQLEAENRAAELEAKSAAEQLAFLREQEATRKSEWQMTQEKNYGLEQDRLNRLAPYRRAGRGSLAQLLQPLALRG